MITPRTSTTTTYTGASELAHLDLRRPRWTTRALCRDAAVLASVGGCFITAEDDKATRDAALDVCRRCPVRAECLAWAIELDDQLGIAGGTTTAERRAIRKTTTRQETTSATT